MPDFPDTRWSLIGRLAEQPDQAGELMAVYADPLSRYLRRKFPREQARNRLDDIVQESLMWLIEHPEVLARAQPGQGSRFRYFVMTLAFNQARNALRRTEHGHEVGGPLDDDGATLAEVLAVVDHPPASAADRDMDHAWAESVIAAAWRDLAGWAGDGTLDPDIPDLLDAHLIAGRTVREVAESSGLPLATCHRRLARGKTYLQRAIVERLRAAGEISADASADDTAAACDVLLSALR